MGKLNAVFIRNGKEHSAVAAEAHLRTKLNAAQGSLFAPAKERWTAKLFIEKIASGSSITDEKYQIKFQDGRKVEAKEWFLAELKKLESHGKP